MTSKSHSRLSGLRVYLSGAMEKCSTFGVDWREKITPSLEEMGLNVLDPTKKKTTLSFASSCSEEHETLVKLRENKRYNELRENAKEVTKVDLSTVDRSDLMIMRIDLNCFSFGTIDEFSFARLLKKPVLVWAVQGKDKMPIWLFGRMPHEYIFDTQEELLECLDDLAFSDEPEPIKKHDKNFTTILYQL